MHVSRYAFGSLACIVIACNSERVLAPRVATIDGVPFRAQASLVRDFMPSTAPGGPPLTVAIRIQTADSSSIPTGVAADSAWMYNGSAVWRTAVLEEQPRSSSYFDVIARGGPTWAPGTEVDVLVRLRDGAGHSVLLQTPPQRIARVD